MLRPLLIIDHGSLQITKMHLEGLSSGEISFSDLVSGGVVEWVDAEEEEDLLIAPRPFDLPSFSPKNNRPINPAMVEWTNLGEHGISHAHVSAEVKMPNGETKIEKFKVPLNYYQENIDALKRKEKKAHTVLVYTNDAQTPIINWGSISTWV
jgi:DNA-directed RNA polymerase beta subunit